MNVARGNRFQHFVGNVAQILGSFRRLTCGQRNNFVKKNKIVRREFGQNGAPDEASVQRTLKDVEARRLIHVQFEAAGTKKKDGSFQLAHVAHWHSNTLPPATRVSKKPARAERRAHTVLHLQHVA